MGVEATGNSQWFVELLQRLGHEVWIGDAAEIRASYVRKQKTDKRDAGHILKLLVEGPFSAAVGAEPGAARSAAAADSSAQAGGDSERVKNGLQHLALNRGMQKQRRLWSEAGQKLLRELPLTGWAAVPAARSAAAAGPAG